MILDSLENEETFSDIVTVNGHMYGIFKYCEAIAKSAEPVLITGEPGTGRSLLAKSIHAASGRSGRIFFLDAAGVDAPSICGMLFGAARKDSSESRPQEGSAGVEECLDGTLVLKNIHVLDDETQKRLVRLIEEKTYIPMDGGAPRRASVRVIAVSGLELAQVVQGGQFRRDLSEKLQDHHVELPPLRERREDIPFLLNHFTELYASRRGVQKPPVPAQLISRLMGYEFPGNVKELELLVMHSLENYAKGIALLDSFTEKLAERLPQLPFQSGKETDTADSLVGLFGHFPTVDEAVDFLIAEAIKLTDGNKKAAADILQITRQTINRRLRLKR